MSTTIPLRLDSGQNCNFVGGGGAVAILNDASALHDRIGYLWGLTDQLSTLVDVFMHHDSEHVKDVATALYWHIKPMAALLEHMADETQHDRGGQP